MPASQLLDGADGARSGTCGSRRRRRRCRRCRRRRRADRLQTPCGSAAPAGLGVQVPSEDDSAQLRQAPGQATSQQTPSTQKLQAHSLPAEQGCPFDLGPQLPLTQLWPVTQSASVAQWLMQAPPVHSIGRALLHPLRRGRCRGRCRCRRCSRRSPLQVGGEADGLGGVLGAAADAVAASRSVRRSTAAWSRRPWGSARPAPSAAGPDRGRSDCS